MKITRITGAYAADRMAAITLLLVLAAPVLGHDTGVQIPPLAPRLNTESYRYYKLELTHPSYLHSVHVAVKIGLSISQTDWGDKHIEPISLQVTNFNDNIKHCTQVETITLQLVETDNEGGISGWGDLDKGYKEWRKKRPRYVDLYTGRNRAGQLFEFEWDSEYGNMDLSTFTLTTAGENGDVFRIRQCKRRFPRARMLPAPQHEYELELLELIKSFECRQAVPAIKIAAHFCD